MPLPASASETIDIVRDALRAGVLKVDLSLHEFETKLTELATRSSDAAADFVQELWDQI